MRKSIFEIENRINIQKEFLKLIANFHKNTSGVYTSIEGWYSYIELINKKIFLNWKYRDTMLDVYEYFEHIGISQSIRSGVIAIDEELFLYYIEFILNMTDIALRKSIITKFDDTVLATLQNIQRILEKMNYKSEDIEDRVIIIKRNADVDSILDKVPLSIAEVLLEYNDFKNCKDITNKKAILKDLDLYIEKNKSKIKEIDSKLFDSIGTIVNKMGVNHPINEEPYKSYKLDDLLKWYDKCFLMMIHAIRSIDISEIKKEREELVKK